MWFPRAAAFAAFLIAGVTQRTAADQIGPSFDCAAVRQPLAQFICADTGLSQTDLRFAQAYFALLPQLDDAGKRDLKQEDLRFLDAVQQHCGISSTGPVPAQSDPMRKCVKDAYESQRSVWLLRLTPPFSEEANRPIERVLALQRCLQQLGFLPADAKIDGVYGAGTRDAISRWQTAHGRSATGILGDADAQALEEQASARSTPVTADAGSESKPGAAAGNSHIPSTSADKVGPPVDKQGGPDIPVGIENQAAAVQERAVTAVNQPSGATGVELNADDTKRIVDEAMNREPYYTLLLGNVTVYGGPFGTQMPVPSGNNISAKQYDGYKAWTQVGIIKIASQGQLSQQAFSWNNWMAQGQGIQEQIIVSTVCKEMGICKVIGNTLKVKQGAFKADRLIKNEERTIGVHTYRILMGTYSADWTPPYQSFCRISNQCGLTDKGKFMMLLKYDEFSNSWKAITWDYAANIDGDFTTHNVDQQIRAAQ
jgi:peptidoglycan hydrolase-like protein with peptidoglycan-binding domain